MNRIVTEITYFVHLFFSLLKKKKTQKFAPDWYGISQNCNAETGGFDLELKGRHNFK